MITTKKFNQNQQLIYKIMLENQKLFNPNIHKINAYKCKIDGLDKFFNKNKKEKYTYTVQYDDKLKKWNVLDMKPIITIPTLSTITNY